ncbi:plant UBX domain-containing protein 10-like [Aristolochia californica]|uniref:plant UBX domain-containing protein 10-like n=1 Tax=Aristolochia californica TaxID=171875 RepID=UPI0035D560EF
MIRRRENGLVRRIVNLPLSIAGGVSRAVGQGISQIGTGRREHRVYFQPPHEVSVAPEDWFFHKSYEEEYGFSHPFFYACRFAEALKIAEEEKKLLFVYLHSPEHPYTPPFCSETLGSDLVVQFLDSNFVSWGAIPSRGEGLQMTSALRAFSFPFCAVLAPVSGGSIAVLQQVEGPVSPAELVEILQRTTEEQGLAFRTPRATEDERIKANRQLRQEQDAAYNAALQIDKERGRLQDLAIEEAPVNRKTAAVRTKKDIDMPNRNVAATKQTGSKVKEAITVSHNKTATTPGKNSMVTQIQIRFPDGERKEQSFICTDNIQSVYRYIDSLNKPGIGSYRLIFNFPRKVYGFDQLGMTLKDAGLHPSATLFLELL